jgi:hypothetical protein
LEASVAERIQLRRAKGWRKPPNTVVVARPSKWGNPFDFRRSEFCWIALGYGCRGDRRGRQEASVRAYREWLAEGAATPEGHRLVGYERAFKFGEVTLAEAKAGSPPTPDEIETLRGKNLACWCRPGDPCHADVLLELANRPRCEAP